jgi:hypothetical protein
MHNLTRFFNYLAGAILLALASAMFIANVTSSELTHPKDPVFEISTAVLFWIILVLELAVALVCLFGRQIWLQASLVFWLAMNLAAYQWALASSGVTNGFKGYLGPLADAFGILPGMVEMALKAAVSFLLLGSFLVLSSLAVRKFLGSRSTETPEYSKIACPHCAGRIAFPTSGAGMQIPCPHCAAGVTLEQPR